MNDRVFSNSFVKKLEKTYIVLISLVFYFNEKLCVLK